MSSTKKKFDPNEQYGGRPIGEDPDEFTPVCRMCDAELGMLYVTDNDVLCAECMGKEYERQKEELTQARKRIAELETPLGELAVTREEWAALSAQSRHNLNILARRAQPPEVPHE